MKPAMFIFSDDEFTSCVYVHECDDDRAKQMIGRTLASPFAWPNKQYDPLEATSVFVAANKSKPFDMLFVGEFNQDDAEIEDITQFYEVTPSEVKGALMVVPIDTTKTEPTEAWLIRAAVLH